MRLSLHTLRQGALSVALLSGCTASAVQAQTYTCGASNESPVLAIKNYIVRLVTASNDTLLTNTRSRYQLPAGNTNSVKVESKASICAQAAQAYHQALHGSNPPISRRVTVLKVGNNRYVVADPQELAGEYNPVIIFSTQWAVLASFES